MIDNRLHSVQLTGVSLSELFPCTEDEVRKLISVSNEVLCARSFSDVFTEGADRRSSTILDCDGQCLTERRSATINTEACCSYTTTEEVWSRCRGTKELSARLKFDVCIQTSGEGSCITTRLLLECQWINASTAVGVPTSPQH